MCKEFSKTRFITVPVKLTPDYGIPIGQGKCSAVRLRINAFQRNSTGLAQFGANAAGLVYYGDAQSQENELTAIADVTAGRIQFQINNWSPKIYCEHLEEVLVRTPYDLIQLQVMILLSDEDLKS